MAEGLSWISRSRDLELLQRSLEVARNPTVVFPECHVAVRQLRLKPERLLSLCPRPLRHAVRRLGEAVPPQHQAGESGARQRKGGVDLNCLAAESLRKSEVVRVSDRMNGVLER